MQKVKQIFSGHESSEARDTSPRTSLSGSQGYDTNEPNSSMSKNWALGALGDSGDTTTGTTGGSGYTGDNVTGSNVHSGSTGAGSNIGRDSSNISGSGLGNAATGAGTSERASGYGGRDILGTGTGSGLSSSGNNTGSGLTGSNTGSGISGGRDSTGRIGPDHRDHHHGSTGVTGGSTGGALSSGTNRDSTLGGTTTGSGVGERERLAAREGLTGDRYASQGQTGAREGLTGDRYDQGTTGRTSGLTGSTGATGTTGTTGSTGGHFVDKLTGQHTVGHDSRDTSRFDPAGENTTHDHKHLQAVHHAHHRHTEVEEVERQRETHRHVHHLQHHVQPVAQQSVRDETLAQNNVPVTQIQEKHVNTDEDVRLFRSLGEKHRDTEEHLPKERTVVDLGERVNTVTHHHVHHVTQPVVEEEIHNRHRIHTTVPLVHTIHEAPIIHKSSVHEPVQMADFLKGGGKLDSGIRHQDAGLLATGECERTVDGVGEKLMEDLHLRSGNSYGSSGNTTGGSYGSGNTTSGSYGSGNTTGATGTTGTTGTTGSRTVQ